MLRKFCKCTTRNPNIITKDSYAPEQNMLHVLTLEAGGEEISFSESGVANCWTCGFTVHKFYARAQSIESQDDTAFIQ